MDRARAAMIEANMPTELWPFAVQTAALITNLLPTRANSDFQSPHYRLFTALGLSQEASVPYIKHLRVFGCTAYVHLKRAYRANTDKFGPRAEVGRLVGYDSHHGRILYVWFPDTGRIQIPSRPAKTGRIIVATSCNLWCNQLCPYAST